MLGQQMQQVGDSVLTGQTSFAVSNSGLVKQVAVAQKGFASVSRNSVKQHKKTRDQIDQGNTKVIDAVCAKLDDLPRNLAQTYMSSMKSNREIRFHGQSMESMLGSLFLLKPALHRAILHALSEQRERVSTRHLYWLQSEFENLVSSATQEVAATSENSTASSIDNWVYSRGLGSSISAKDEHIRTPISKKRSRYESKLSNSTTASDEKLIRKKQKLSRRCFSFTLPAGEITIMVPSPIDVLANASDSCSFNEVGFSFSPQPGICSTHIRGHFVEGVNSAREPQLYAQLTAFTLCEDFRPYFGILGAGTLEEIDVAFRVGKISPYAVGEDGCNIFWVRILLLASTDMRKLFHFLITIYSVQHFTVDWIYFNI